MKLYLEKINSRDFTLLGQWEKGELIQLIMFKVDRTIRDQIGTCKKISEEFKDRSWMVEVLSEEQERELRKLVQEDVRL